MTRNWTSVDLFAGGGGASTGIARALGRSPVLAVNHDRDAVAMHAANHPESAHLCESVLKVSPWAAARFLRGRRLDHLHGSPDCTHFSVARGGKPRDKGIRGLAWVLVEWAEALVPRVLTLENVQEFTSWGPLDESGHPIKERAGETFREFIGRLNLLGYRVEYRVLCAADYGAPTSRRRLFLVGRNDGQPIVWPAPTHGPGRSLPWRTAAEIIDWSIPCPSIFERARPLAEATQRRIAEGLKRYVIEGSPSLKSARNGLCAPTLIQIGYGERRGQAPRVLDLARPLGTVVAGGNKYALVTAWLAKHYTGVVGSSLDAPVGTVTSIDHHSPVAASLTKFFTAELPVGCGHVAAFLLKYYGSIGQHQGLNEPLHTVVSKARFGLITIELDGNEYAITDIGMRMLTPRELARAQGFDDSYILIGSKASQIARIGNSVPPDVIEAIVAAQFQQESQRAEAYAP